MKLKHGKKYETADGVVYRVEKLDQPIDYLTFESSNCYYNDLGVAVGIERQNDLIRRHYRKPQPAHKLDLKPCDVVELMEWEDGDKSGFGVKIKIGRNGNLYHYFYELNGWDKGQRPLFRVVSRA